MTHRSTTGHHVHHHSRYFLHGLLLGSLLVVSSLSIHGCGGGGGGGGGGVAAVEPDIIFSRNRDLGGLVAPILSESGSGFDASEVDSPAIVVDSGRPGGDRFLLYYEGSSGAAVSTIGVVSSTSEKFSTLDVNRVEAVGLGAGGSGFDVGATDPCVIVDKGIAFNTDGRYLMWFEGRSGAGGGTSTIIFASSADGESWGSFTQCTGLNPSFGSIRVADPCVIRDSGIYKMWFEAIDTTISGGVDGPGVIGYATSSDGIAWTVRDAFSNTGASAQAVFLPGTAGQFDGYSVNAPSVVEDDGALPGDPRRFLMFYESGDKQVDTENFIGVAFSADGLNWSDPATFVLDTSSDRIPLPFDSGDVEHPTAFIDLDTPPTTSGRYLLWYTGDGESGSSPNRIGLAKGRNP